MPYSKICSIVYRYMAVYFTLDVLYVFTPVIVHAVMEAYLKGRILHCKRWLFSL